MTLAVRHDQRIERKQSADKPIGTLRRFYRVARTDIGVTFNSGLLNSGNTWSYTATTPWHIQLPLRDSSIHVRNCCRALLILQPDSVAKACSVFPIQFSE